MHRIQLLTVDENKKASWLVRYREWVAIVALLLALAYGLYWLGELGEQARAAPRQPMALPPPNLLYTVDNCHIWEVFSQQHGWTVVVTCPGSPTQTSPGTQ